MNPKFNLLSPEHECFGENTEYQTELNELYWQWKTEMMQKDLESILAEDNFDIPRVKENKIPSTDEQKIIL